MADDAVPAELANAFANATEGLRTDVIEGRPDGAPDPTPAVEVAPSVPVPPVETAPAAPTTIDPTNLSPEAKRFLEMHGGDPNKALAKALADNNRLAELHRSGQPTVAPPVAATPPVQTPQVAPTVEAPAPAVELPPVVIDPVEIQRAAKQFVASDPTCLQLDQQFTTNLTRLQQISAEEAKFNTENQRKAWELELAEVQADPMRQADIRTAIRDNRSELLALKQEKLVLESENARTGAQWQQRKDQYERQVYAHLQGQKEAERQKEYHAAQQAQAEQALVESWPTAIKSAMEANGIPAEEQAAFNAYCKNAAIAELDFGLIDRVEAQQFASQKAAEFAAMIERHHRLRSATYGQQATQRAQINNTPGPVAVATEAPKQAFKSLDEAIAAADAGFRADMLA